MAIDADTTTITISKATAKAIDKLVESGVFADQNEAVSAAMIELEAKRARPNRYEVLVQEGLDDLEAGRFEEATPEFFERLRNEARARAQARRRSGERWTPDPDVFGTFDDH